MFDHHLMAKASERIGSPTQSPFHGIDPATVHNLREIAQSFSRLQKRRHVADYDNATFWTHTDALDEVTTAATAFSLWHSIKTENIAQDYLVSLLIRPRS